MDSLEWKVIESRSSFGRDVPPPHVELMEGKRRLTESAHTEANGSHLVAFSDHTFLYSPRDKSSGFGGKGRERERKGKGEKVFSNLSFTPCDKKGLKGGTKSRSQKRDGCVQDAA